MRHCSPTDHLISATSSGPPPCWLHGPPNTVSLTRRASVNFDNLVTLNLTEPDKANFRPTGNSRAVQNSLRLVYFSTQSFHKKASEINDLTVDGDFDILLMPEIWLCASDDEAYITEMTLSGYLFHSFHASAAGVAALDSCSSPLCLTPFLCILYLSTRLSRWNCGYPVIAHLSRPFAYIPPPPPPQQAKQTVKQNVY